MRKLLVHLSVALLTFALGVCATTVRLGRFEQLANDRAMGEARDGAAAAAPLPGVYSSNACTYRIGEAPEEKAVRLAEEFIARNGYTDSPPDRDNLSYESIEWASDNDKLLWARHDSLERKAYGMQYSGRTDEAGWTVAFKYRKHSGGNGDKVGRAVTMDRDFGNLRVEHKDFFLSYVHKKF